MKEILSRNFLKGEVVVLHIEFKVFLIVNLLSLIFYSLGVGLVMIFRKCPRMDRKAWWNIGINLVSFAFKSIAWVEI
jgi:hypothetical protein